MGQRHSQAGPLAATHPELATQVLPPFDPMQLTQGSDLDVWWRGPLGHVWCASPAERVRGEGCPVCSGLQAPPPGRSLAEVHPDVARDADGWDPARLSAGSRVEMPWRCHRCGATWTAEVRARAKGYRRCPECDSKEHPSLVVTHPLLAAEMIAPFDPADYTQGSKAKVRWRGPVGHEWDATVGNRVKGSGCPVCAFGSGARARRTPEPGASLADVRPDVAGEADGWDPTQYRPKSNARLPWRCTECGHRWSTTVYQRTQRSGCPACARTRRRKS